MPPQGRLAHKGASRPLLAEDLQAEDVVNVIIAGSGEFVAAWREIDAGNASVDVHGGLKLLAVGIEEVDVASTVANRKDVAIWRVAQAEDTVVNLQ